MSGTRYSMWLKVVINFSIFRVRRDVCAVSSSEIDSTEHQDDTESPYDGDIDTESHLSANSYPPSGSSETVHSHTLYQADVHDRSISCV